MDQGSVLDTFHPVVKEWFSRFVGTPSLPQILGWPQIQAGKNVLISAPTGAGKTLAAFLESIDFLLKRGLEKDLPEGVFILYVSPLKALNNDIYKNLDVPLKGIQQCCREAGIPFPEITKAVRTGDTPQHERQRMLKNPPHILITTPESLYLMLTSKNSLKMLKNVRYLIVDEIHTMLGNKRGVHLALSIERLEKLTDHELVRIGLSATVNPIDTAASYLGGLTKTETGFLKRPVTIVAPRMDRMKDLSIFMPVADYRALEQGTIWPEIYESIYKLIKQHQSTIVFVNNRAVAERVAANLNSMEDKEICRPHHGSLSKTKRLEVEERFKEGDLTCIIATSTLELGIDIGSVDLMIQVASPLSVSSGLQRLGRAGHRLDATSKGKILPKTRGDLLKSAFMAEEMLAGSIEQEKIPENCLDILAQHIVSMCCERTLSEGEMLEVIRSTWSYRDLKESDYKKVLAMLAGDFEHLDDIPTKPRIQWDRQNKTLEGTGYSRMLAVNSSGTIPDRGYFPVVLADYKTRIGELDEVFVFEARLGDRFMLGNSAWKIDKIEKNRVIVSPGSSVGAKTPFWQGDGIGSPYEQGIAFGKYLCVLDQKLDSEDLLAFLMTSGSLDETAAMNINNYLVDQKEALGVISHNRRIVVEYLKDEVSDLQIVIHAHFGGKVNSVLAILLQKALEDILRCQAFASHNNDCILIHLYGCPDSLSHIFSLLKPSQVERAMIEMLPGTSRFAMTFRYNAYRSLMMGIRNLGQRLPLWIQRLRSVDALENARKTMDHPLIIETMRECLDELFDIPHAIQVLKEIQSGVIEVVEKNAWFPSPFASELLFEFKFMMMYAEKDPHPADIKSPVVTGIDALSLSYRKDEAPPVLLHEAIAEVKQKHGALSKLDTLTSPNELHSFLLIYGDMTSLEVPTGKVQEWMAHLIKSGRVMAIKGSDHLPDLLAAIEELELYASALNRTTQELTDKPPSWITPEDTWTQDEAITRIIRRFTRYHSPFEAEDIVYRYGLTLTEVSRVLNRLQTEEMLVKGHFENPEKEAYCHIKVYEAMVRAGSTIRANEVMASPANVYAGFLPAWQSLGSDSSQPLEALYETIRQMEGLFLPWDWWESIVFPARVKGYSPGHLDKLCASGRVFWRIHPENEDRGLLLAWYSLENACVDRETEGVEKAALKPEEERIYGVLLQKGACFVHVLTALTGLQTATVLDALEELALKGLVINDSFIPIRYLMSKSHTNAKGPASPAVEKAKRMAFAVSRMDMGRWEVAWRIMDNDLQKLIDRWFKRYGLLSRDSLSQEKSPFTWNEVYEALKQREYAGSALRGYFIEGISGIQFMLPEAYKQLNLYSDYQVINACDPAQAYGKILARKEEALAFTNIPGTVMVFHLGNPIVIADKFGDRILLKGEKDEIFLAIQALKEAFVSKRIWPDRKKIAVKFWPEDPMEKELLVEALTAAGFKNDILRMVLWR